MNVVGGGVVFVILAGGADVITGGADVAGGLVGMTMPKTTGGTA